MQLVQSFIFGALISILLTLYFILKEILIITDYIEKLGKKND